VESLQEGHRRVNPPPLACVSTPHHVEADVSQDLLGMIEPSERGIEFLASIVRMPGTVASYEAEFIPAPAAEECNRIVELCRPDDRQEAGPDHGVDEARACRGDGGFVFGAEGSNPDPRFVGDWPALLAVREILPFHVPRRSECQWRYVENSMRAAPFWAMERESTLGLVSFFSPPLPILGFRREQV
jgi:hypothetical protein